MRFFFNLAQFLSLSILNFENFGNFCNFVTLPTKRTKTIFIMTFIINAKKGQGYKNHKRLCVLLFWKNFVFGTFSFFNKFFNRNKSCQENWISGHQQKCIPSPTRLKAKLLTHDADNVVLLVFQLTCQNLRKLQRSNREHSFQLLKMNFHAQKSKL